MKWTYKHHDWLLTFYWFLNKPWAFLLLLSWEYAHYRSPDFEARFKWKPVPRTIKELWKYAGSDPE